MITVDKPQKIIAEKGCCSRRAAGKRKNGKLTRRVVRKGECNIGDNTTFFMEIQISFSSRT